MRIPLVAILLALAAPAWALECNDTRFSSQLESIRGLCEEQWRGHQRHYEATCVETQAKAFAGIADVLESASSPDVQQALAKCIDESTDWQCRTDWIATKSCLSDDVGELQKFGTDRNYGDSAPKLQ